ncbi:3-oxoacyl-[acyl-carrier protein] reductase [Halobacteriovorax marinus SJ]|uniref:3-oxoacyl-[acyl-carrier protein] reductase n=1 Tax=Halobacteriovorax marinus (strain ATCC BAA-682 / DSM 15412 / SJ) TaxID=862908 RepID=E1X067_HALMS|nr:SDR family NAD(P)-dependent oxidoreductase [Halobacteriovorax marinus]CBW26294.1 3-oxoacyl-[acyl-carrier protein] reductase [Halobacteriovorax marinus SJ]
MMNFNFNEKIVVVTGGTRGIGKGVTTAFLENGAKVIATYTSNDEAANAFKDSLGELAKNIDLRKFDVSLESDVTDFYNYLESEYERVDILVNNSGIRKDHVLALMPSEDWDKVLDVNLKGTFLMTKMAIPLMMRNRFGRVINMSSVGGALGLSGQANYAASKAGQVALSKSLSKEVGKKGITINNICPGFIETELISDLPAEQVKEYKKQVPLKRFGKVEEVASAVLFLASEHAAYITGTSLEITGGL